MSTPVLSFYSWQCFISVRLLPSLKNSQYCRSITKQNPRSLVQQPLFTR
ncbi:hypothetical protein ACU8KH_03510 [Lachancea thermotolerans]